MCSSRLGVRAGTAAPLVAIAGVQIACQGFGCEVGYDPLVGTTHVLILARSRVRQVVRMDLTTPWMGREPTVYLIDPDPSTRRLLFKEAESLGLGLECFSAPNEFLAQWEMGQPGCLFVNLDAPSVPEPAGLFRTLWAGRVHLPVVALSQKNEVRWAVEAMKAGALEYLQKPCRAEELSQAMKLAICWEAEYREDILLSYKVRRRMERLSRAEREVLDRVVLGLSNLEMAAELNRSVRAIEQRRARLMAKMKARTLAELVRMIVLARCLLPEQDAPCPEPVRRPSLARF